MLLLQQWFFSDCVRMNTEKKLRFASISWMHHNFKALLDQHWIVAWARPYAQFLSKASSQQRPAYLQTQQVELRLPYENRREPSAMNECMQPILLTILDSCECIRQTRSSDSSVNHAIIHLVLPLICAVLKSPRGSLEARRTRNVIPLSLWNLTLYMRLNWRCKRSS